MTFSLVNTTSKALIRNPVDRFCWYIDLRMWILWTNRWISDWAMIPNMAISPVVDGRGAPLPHWYVGSLCDITRNVLNIEG